MPSSLVKCWKQISEVAQRILGVDIEGETLFKAVPLVGTAPTPATFSFGKTLQFKFKSCYAV